MQKQLLSVEFRCIRVLEAPNAHKEVFLIFNFHIVDLGQPKIVQNIVI